MSNDGEITVEVSAEGTDEAADQLAGEGGGGGDGGGGEGLTQSIRGGIVGGLLAAGLGSVLDILSPILDILNAFLAPIAAIIFRVLQPVLAILLNRVLPAFLSFMTEYDDAIVAAIQFLLNPLAFILGNLGQIRDRIETLRAALAEAIRNRIDRVVQRLRQLPSQIGSALRGVLPDFPSVPSFPSFGSDGSDDGGGGVLRSAGQTIVNIGGGVPAFIDEVTRSRRTDG